MPWIMMNAFWSDKDHITNTLSETRSQDLNFHPIFIEEKVPFK